MPKPDTPPARVEPAEDQPAEPRCGLTVAAEVLEKHIAWMRSQGGERWGDHGYVLSMVAAALRQGARPDDT